MINANAHGMIQQNIYQMQRQRQSPPKRPFLSKIDSLEESYGTVNELQSPILMTKNSVGEV